jgi:malonyl CoA-acyl carrier protein transacylase
MAHDAAVAVRAARCEHGNAGRFVRLPVCQRRVDRGDLPGAGYNFKKSFVVSALKGPMDAVQRFLKERAITFLSLPVAYPFHSKEMDLVRIPVHASLEKLSLAPPRSR